MAKEIAAQPKAPPKYDGPTFKKGGQPVYILNPQVLAVLPNGENDSILVLPGASIHVDGTPLEALAALEDE